MLRHDLIGELCESALKFHQAGGVNAALPKGVTSGRANLRKGNEDLSLYVYGNVTIKNLITTKFGPGVQYEVACLVDSPTTVFMSACPVMGACLNSSISFPLSGTLSLIKVEGSLFTLHCLGLRS